MNTSEEGRFLFLVYKRMYSIMMLSLGFAISIARVHSGGPPDHVVTGGPNTGVGNNAKGGTPPSVGSGFGHEDSVRVMNSKFSI